MAQVADVDLFRAGGPQGVQGFPQKLFRRGTRVEFAGQLICRHRKKLPQSPERAGVGTPIVEDAEYSGVGDTPAIALLEERLDPIRAVVRYDLREVEVGREIVRAEVLDLLSYVAMRVRPTTQGQPRLTLANPLPEHVGVWNTACRTHRGVSTHHRERLEPQGVRTIRIYEAMFDRVLAREKGNESRERHIGADVGRKMPEVLLFPRSDRIIRQENEDALEREIPDGVVEVDPAVHPLGSRKPTPWRPKLHRDERPRTPQTVHQRRGHACPPTRRSISSGDTGNPAVSTSCPAAVTTTSSSILIPMPTYSCATAESSSSETAESSSGP